MTPSTTDDFPTVCGGEGAIWDSSSLETESVIVDLQEANDSVAT